MYTGSASDGRLYLEKISSNCTPWVLLQEIAKGLTFLILTAFTYWSPGLAPCQVLYILWFSIFATTQHSKVGVLLTSLRMSLPQAALFLASMNGEGRGGRVRFGGSQSTFPS